MQQRKCHAMCNSFKLRCTVELHSSWGFKELMKDCLQLQISRGELKSLRLKFAYLILARVR